MIVGYPCFRTPPFGTHLTHRATNVSAEDPWSRLLPHATCSCAAVSGLNLHAFVQKWGVITDTYMAMLAEHDDK